LSSGERRGSTIFKAVNVNKTINIFRPVVINKSVDIDRNITINKNVVINKNVLVNKGNAIATAQANAFALAAAQARGAAPTIVYAGSYQIINYNRRGGVALAVAAAPGSGACRKHEATVVKSIHAVCVGFDGQESAAAHMVADTWIESGYEGEVARCTPGSRLKVVIGDVVQSDQGLAGTYDHGQVLRCGAREVLRHFKDGQLKCAPAVPVPDGTERANLRRWGTGDVFFAFRTAVCVTQGRAAEVSIAREAEVGGMMLDGGVGERSGY
jgi:hypothetical protein